MTQPTSRFVVAIAAVFIVIATAIPVVTVPAAASVATLAIAPVLA